MFPRSRLFRRSVLAALAPALAGCAAVEPFRADAVVGKVVQVSWVRSNQCWAVAPKLIGAKLDPTMVGYFWISKNVCYVCAPDREPYGTLGHEMKHCFDGLFH